MEGPAQDPNSPEAQERGREGDKRKNLAFETRITKSLPSQSYLVETGAEQNYYRQVISASVMVIFA